eukprot:51306-Chlamydomonas_euryale.AAC.1
MLRDDTKGGISTEGYQGRDINGGISTEGYQRRDIKQYQGRRKVRACASGGEIGTSPKLRDERRNE